MPRIAFLSASCCTIVMVVLQFQALTAAAATTTATTTKPSTPDPEEVWNSWLLPDIRQSFLRCEERYYSRPGPIHSPAVWQRLRETYRSVLSDPHLSEFPFHEPPQEGSSSGFAIPFHVETTPEKGRGIYASQTIPKGALIWKSIYTAEFQDAATYRTFLSRLPPSLACDVIMWAYTRRRASDGRVVACVDLDPASFTNDANSAQDLNMALVPATDYHSHTGCRLHFHAVRDIEIGEELAIDYGFSEGEAGWVEMGLSRWEDEEEENEDNDEEDWEWDL